METTVAAFERFSAMFAVLDIARLPICAPADAAVQAMRVFAQRYGKRLEALNPGVDVSGYFHVTIDADVDSGRRLLAGEEITVRELLGEGYDIDADEVQLFRYSPGARSSVIFDGLAHALLDPPYGLRRPEDFGVFGSPEHAAREKAWMRDVLRAFCAEVLALDDPGHASHLRIHRWPTDWSSFFNAGREWWGAFFWTVEDTRNEWITVIAASSTD